MAQSKHVIKPLRELKGRIYDERLYFQCPVCTPTHTCVVPFKTRGWEMKGETIDEATIITPTKFIAGFCKVFFSLIDGVIYAKPIKDKVNYAKREDTDTNKGND